MANRIPLDQLPERLGGTLKEKPRVRIPLNQLSEELGGPPKSAAAITSEPPLEKKQRAGTVVGGDVVDMTPPLVFNQQEPKTEFVDLGDGIVSPEALAGVKPEVKPEVKQGARSAIGYTIPVDRVTAGGADRAYETLNKMRLGGQHPYGTSALRPEDRPIEEEIKTDEIPVAKDGYGLKELREQGLDNQLLNALRERVKIDFEAGTGMQPDPEDGLTESMRRVFNNFDRLPLEQRQNIFNKLSTSQVKNIEVGEVVQEGKVTEEVKPKTGASLNFSSMESYDQPKKRVTVVPSQLDALGFDPAGEALDVTTAKVSPDDAFVRGLGMTKEMYKNISTSTQAQFSAQAIENKRKLLELYKRLDAGERLPSILQEFAPSTLQQKQAEEAARQKGVPYGSRMLSERSIATGISGLTPEQTYLNNFGRAYLSGSTADRAYFKDTLTRDIEQSTKAYKEILPKLNKFMALSQKYREGIPNLADAKSVDDVVNVLSFYTANGLATILPIALGGFAGGPPGAVAVAAPLNLAGNINNRYNHLLKLFAGLETDEEKAEAMIKYLDVTKDETLRAGITSTLLDTALGPVGRIVKARYVKDLATKTGKEKAKEAGIDIVTEGTAEALQRTNEIASEIRLREKKGPLFTKENFKAIAEDFVAGAVGSAAFKGVEFTSAPAIKQAYTMYENMKANYTVNKLLEGDSLEPEEKAYILAQINEGVKPIDALASLQVNWGQKEDPVLPERSDPEEFVEQAGVDNPNIVSFLYRNNELQDDVKRGKYTKEDADVIAARAWVLINDEDVPAIKAFNQAKQEVAQEQTRKEDEAVQAAETTVTNSPELVKEAEQVIAEEAQTNPVIGFTTEKGSTYTIDKNQRTSRTKNSPGEGQGQTYPPAGVLYLSPNDVFGLQMAGAEARQEIGKENLAIRLGYATYSDDWIPTYNTVEDATQIPKGAEAKVLLVNRNTGATIQVFNAQRNPQVGLHPVEKTYFKDGTSTTHLGNKIVSLNQEVVEEVDTTVEEEPVVDPINMPAVVRRRNNAPITRGDIDTSSIDTRSDEDFTSILSPKPTVTDANKAADELANEWEVLNNSLDVLTSKQKQDMYGRAAEIIANNPDTEAARIAGTVLENATAYEKNLANNQAKSKAKFAKLGVSNLFSNYQTDNTVGNAFGQISGLFISPESKSVVNDILRASEGLFSPEVRQGIRSEWQKAYDAAMQGATEKQKKILRQIPAAINGNAEAQAAVQKAYQDKTLNQQQYQLANPSQWWASNARNILSGPTESGSWQASAAAEQKGVIDDFQQLMQLDATDPVIQAMNEATNNRVTEQPTADAERVVNERIDAELADTPIDGTVADLKNESIEPTQEQKDQLDDAIDNTPPVNSLSPTEVLDAETQDRLVRGYYVASRKRLETLKVLVRYFNVLSPRKQVYLLALLQTSDIHRLFKRYTKDVFGPDDPDHIANIIEEVRTMNAKTGRWIAQYRPLVEAWNKVNSTKAGPLLAQLMNLSTKLGIDVNKQTREQLLDPTTMDPNTGEIIGDRELIRLRDALNRTGEKELSPAGAAAVSRQMDRRRSEIRVIYQLKNQIEQLPNGAAALEVYEGVKKAYRDFFDTYERVLKENIKNLALDPEKEQQMLEAISERFNLARANIPVYFKISRRGNNFIRIKLDPKFAGFYQLTDSEYEAAQAFITKPKLEIGRDERNNPIYDYEKGGLGIDWGDNNQVEYGDVKTNKGREKFDENLFASDGMLREMFNIIDSASPEKTKIDATSFKEYQSALKEQLGQLYLQTLPGNNVKTMFFKRNKNSRGESLDNLAAFGETLTSIATQFPRITHAPKIKRELSALHDQTRNLPNQQRVLDPIINEMRDRIRLELSPSQSLGARFAGSANKFAFFWLLTAPKSALLQTTQFPIVVMPLLAEKYGSAVAVGTVGKYIAAYDKLGVGHTAAQMMKGEWEPLSIRNSSYIKNHANKEAMQYAWAVADDYNIFDVTYASDIGNISDLPTTLFSDSAARYFNKGTAKIYQLTTGFFSVAERMTREMTFMSTFEIAYNKAKREGLSEQDARNRAVNEAMAMTQEGLFDYTRFNKPRIMYETPLGQTATQFMSYPVMMNSILVRHAYTIVAEAETLQERRQAAVAFAGILGQTVILAGIEGLWLLSMVVPLLAGLWKAFTWGASLLTSDDEEEKKKKEEKEKRKPSAERWRKEGSLTAIDARYRNDPFLDYSTNDWMNIYWIPKTFGPGGTLSNYIAADDPTWLRMQLMMQKGLPASFGWDLSGSLSLNNMFMQDEIIAPESNIQAMFFNYASQFRIAPVLGALAQIFRGIYQATVEGDIFKGMETGSPAWMKGPVKATRRRMEGKLNYKGQEIIPAQYYTWGKTFQLGLGVPDTMEQMRSRLIFNQSKFEELVNKDRQTLINDYEKTLYKVVNDKSRDPKDFMSANTDNRMIKINEAISEYNSVYPKYGFDPITYEETLPDKVMREGLNRFVARITGGIITNLEQAQSNPLLAAEKLRRARRFLGMYFPGGYITDEEMKQKIESTQDAINQKFEEVKEQRKQQMGEMLENDETEIDWSE